MIVEDDYYPSDDYSRFNDSAYREIRHESHVGKGPKGYQKNDRRIWEEACEVLLQSSVIDASDIEVFVHDGVIKLIGYVNSRKEKWAAEDLLFDMPFIKDVQNEIKIRPSTLGVLDRLTGNPTRQNVRH